MLEKFLLKTKNYNDYLFIKLEEYFKCQTFEERKEIIGEIKKDIKNYDSKYKKYIEFLEYSLKFKKACIDDNYIHYSEIEPYSNTVGDCMLKACKKEKYNWVEGQNKNLDYSNKKLHLMKFRALLEMNNSPAIDAILEKTTLKKFANLTPKIESIIPSDEIFNYRNKITFHVSNDIGFFEKRTNDFIN